MRGALQARSHSSSGPHPTPLPEGEGARACALAAWQRAAGPYWLYVCATPFVAPITKPLPRTPALEPSLAIGAALHAMADARYPALFVDRPIEPSLAAAPWLAERGAAVVPVIQRWCVDPAVLPGAPIGALLEASTPRTRPRTPRAVTFLLDGERAGQPGSRPAPQKLDNRYAYPSCRFPPPSFLRAQGVDAIGWLAPSLAPDLADYAAALAAAGFASRLIRPTEP